jgi:hypothetical protein
MEIYEVLKPVPPAAVSVESPADSPQEDGVLLVNSPVEHGDFAVDPALETTREPLESDGSGV